MDIDGTRTELLNTLQQLQTGANVRLMCTSRFIPEIEEKFSSNLTLEVRASEQDVRRYVAARIPLLPRFVQQSSQLVHDTEKKIAAAVNGMFILAILHVDSLMDTMNKRDFNRILDNLRTGKDALNTAYSGAIKRIEGHMRGKRLVAKQTLSWISYAQRPLTARELCHALAIEPGCKELDPDAVCSIDDVLSVCAGLVIVDSESDVVRLVHYTTQEYLEQIRLEWIPNAQYDIATACLTYLSMDAFANGPCHSDEAFEERLRDHMLLDYIARYWAVHVEAVQQAVAEHALVLLCSRPLVLSTAQAEIIGRERMIYYSQHYPGHTLGIHLTARHGLTWLLELLLEQPGYESTVDAMDDGDVGYTPLLLAAAGGHEAAVKQLLDTGKVDIEAESSWFSSTSLSLAAAGGHEAVVKQLLNTGKVNADAKDSRYNQTPLSLAAEKGYEAVVRQLLNTGKVDINTKDMRGRTPLFLAAAEGHEVVVKQLLDTGKADMEAKDSWWFSQTSLSLAASEGHEAVVKHLLNTGEVDTNTKDSMGRTPLFFAIAGGHKPVVKLLRLEVSSSRPNR